MNLGELFNFLIIEPIFNFLVAIYGLLPGHDFGITLMIFTGVIKLLLWPRMKKQMISSRKIRAINPEIKKLKQKHKNDRQALALETSKIYKEHDVSPGAAIGNMLIQLPILLGLYQAVRMLSGPNQQQQLVNHCYSFVKNIPDVREIIDGVHGIDQAFLGFVDLSRRGYENGSFYLPLVAIAVLAGIFQYYQQKQLQLGVVAGGDKPKKSVRDIIKQEASGKQASQEEISAAAAGNIGKFMPLFTVYLGLTFQGSLAFYWMFNNLITVVLHKTAQEHFDAATKETEERIAASGKDKQGDKKQSANANKSNKKVKPTKASRKKSAKKRRK